MPLGGGIAIHNDAKHKGSAKRNANGGVVGQEAAGHISLVVSDYYGIAAGQSGIPKAFFSITPGPTGPKVSIGVNAYYYHGNWLRIDIGEPSYRFDLDADNRISKSYYANAGANPIVWIATGLTSDKVGCQAITRDRCMLMWRQDEILVSNGNTIGNSPSNLILDNEFTMGATWFVIADAGNGPLTMDIGPPSDPDRLCNNFPTVVGGSGKSNSNDATIPDPWTPAASEVLRVTTNIAVVGLPLTVRVTVFYWDFELPW